MSCLSSHCSPLLRAQEERYKAEVKKFRRQQAKDASKDPVKGSKGKGKAALVDKKPPKAPKKVTVSFAHHFIYV